MKLWKISFYYKALFTVTQAFLMIFVHFAYSFIYLFILFTHTAGKPNKYSFTELFSKVYCPPRVDTGKLPFSMF